jgi:hypothetical protein
MANDTNPGLYRFSGMYGAAYDASGVLLSEVVEVSGTVTRNRIDMPIVGSTRTGYKLGRETREGTIRLQKVDSKWEYNAWTQMSQSLEDRRAARDRGDASLALQPFTLILEYDDPDAVGIEAWRLEGCIASWAMPIGFSITDDIVERDFPLTWEREAPIYAFQAQRTTVGNTTVLTPSWYSGASPA